MYTRVYTEDLISTNVHLQVADRSCMDRCRRLIAVPIECAAVHRRKRKESVHVLCLARLTDSRTSCQSCAGLPSRDWPASLTALRDLNLVRHSSAVNTSLRLVVSQLHNSIAEVSKH